MGTGSSSRGRTARDSPSRQSPALYDPRRGVEPTVAAVQRILKVLRNSPAVCFIVNPILFFVFSQVSRAVALDRGPDQEGMRTRSRGIAMTR